MKPLETNKEQRYTFHRPEYAINSSTHQVLQFDLSHDKFVEPLITMQQ